MDASLIDHPMIRKAIFYPRTASPSGEHDGTLPVNDEIALGYRLYPKADAPAVIIYFHGNGEIASDYDSIAPLYHEAGASLMVIDFRGYGWSTGEPLPSALLGDPVAVHPHVLKTLEKAQLPTDNLYLMGRSLGSTCAIHLAHLETESFKGLIIESGFADIKPLMMLLGVPTQLLNNFRDPVGNLSKLSMLNLPLLVIHGEQDNLIPVYHGEQLHAASPSGRKKFLRIPKAGHNDLMMIGMTQYFAAISAFIRQP